jgi:hypothetical protein
MRAHERAAAIDIHGATVIPVFEQAKDVTDVAVCTEQEMWRVLAGPYKGRPFARNSRESIWSSWR